MTDHLITEIEIKDFKCFDHFKTEGLKRVNLIGGKNNVGKTAFMEACYVNVHAQDIESFLHALHGIKFRRENLNVLANTKKRKGLEFIENSNNIFVKTNVNLTQYKISGIEDGRKLYDFSYKGESIKTNANQLSLETKKTERIEFIDSFGFSDKDIISNYSFIQKKDKEDFLNKSLMNLDSTIQTFKVIDEKPQCKINDKYLEITELGDGVRHLTSIITTLYASEDGYLFIDEMDNGIHYSMLDKVWEIILNLAEELNVQVFATTHSKECIESYGRVAKKLVNKDINFTTLVRNKSNEVVAINYDYDLFLSTLEQEHEVRGW